MGNHDSRTEKVTPEQLKLKSDPFKYAWLFAIPETTSDKAVYEFFRYENRWSPYKWQGLALNPSFPKDAPSELFDEINTSCPPHPLLSYRKRFLIHFFTFHLPVATFATWAYFYLAAKSEKHKKQALLIYVICLVVMSMILVAGSVHRRLKYYSLLGKRVKSLRDLVYRLNRDRYKEKGFRFVVGEQGAWIELRFIDEKLNLVGKKARGAEIDEIEKPLKEN